MKFAAYLRGIETVSCRKRGSASTCLQPTYEGLKRGKCRKKWRWRESLQPTYEGLKRRPAHQKKIGGKFAAYLRGIETNEESFWTGFFQGLQPTYEGLKPTCIATPPLDFLRFAAYLRGIETVLNICRFREDSRCLQPTYEGLKLIILAKPGLPERVCSLRSLSGKGRGRWEYIEQVAGIGFDYMVRGGSRTIISLEIGPRSRTRWWKRKD